MIFPAYQVVVMPEGFTKTIPADGQELKLGIHMHRMRVRIRKISKSKDRQGRYPYIRIRVRLCMIFKYTEIICRKTHDVSANAYGFLA